MCVCVCASGRVCFCVDTYVRGATSESKCRWMQDCDSAVVQSVRVMCAAK